jgi:hypothetical protein
MYRKVVVGEAERRRRIAGYWNGRDDNVRVNLKEIEFESVGLDLSDSE